MRRGPRVALAMASSALLSACHDVSTFSTADGGSYQGAVTSASFVRAGLGPDVQLCLTIDTSNLQTAPGSISTSDGLFRSTSLRPIPQFWNDPLSTFNFGEGRIENVLYVAQGNASDAGTPEGGGTPATPQGDVFVVISFMVSGSIEARLLRGAPKAAGGAPSQVFGVFTLSRMSGPCSF